MSSDDNNVSDSDSLKKHSKSKKNTPRRGERMKKMSLKAVESVSVKDRNFSVSESEFEDYSFLVTTDKPNALHNNELVSGEKIFQFQTPKKSNLLQKVNEQKTESKTPYSLRAKLRKEITAKIKEFSSSEEELFADSGSEYSENEISSDSEEASSSSDSPPETKTSKEINKKVSFTPSRKQKLTSSTNKKDYLINAEDYFSSHSKKNPTSNHTLDKLTTPRLPHDQLQKLLSGINDNQKHEQEINNLHQQYKTYFSKWLLLLHENYNIVLYGLGSKRNILKQFHEEYLNNLHVIVVNGFFPTLSIKDILDSILIEILEIKENHGNNFETCELIEQEFSHMPDTHLYIIVHNIEGNMLRNGKTQSILSRLACLSNIHFIVSVDHINAPLVWDLYTLSKFNFTWWDVTSFSPYLDETSFESSLMVHKTGTLALSALRNVFLSLTTNSKGIYIIIVKYQLKNGSNKYYQGLPFKDLYSSCREAFLVTSDLALRAQLTEFVDHKMVKYKRSADGTENLVIPISNSLLQQFLDDYLK